ncbi:MAG: TIGR02757 family protein [Ferruginibacter sp.]|nr:TIGR02757 family protein [Ferruginibacter sp.]
MFNNFQKELKIFLDQKVDEYNRCFFIETDPICIPHFFSKKQDIEIAGFFAAIFAWGNRTTIINKSKELMRLMDNAPYDFCLHHNEKDLIRLLNFRHRTFHPTDLLYFISFFRQHYTLHHSLETAFSQWMSNKDDSVERALNGFYQYFFSFPDVPQRTRKHIAAPFKKASCKRLNMYLRWMVRKDDKGVDFGIWNKIRSSQLIIPTDLHVIRVAKRLGLLTRKQTDWQAAIELTHSLRKMDVNDPVKYDFALFGLGVMEKF